MTILDENDNLVVSFDPSLGRLIPDRVLIAHHPAVKPVEEVHHYEVVARYPNGGKDLVKVVDTPGVPMSEAWDEFEDIMRFIAYTPEELAEMEANRKIPLEEQIAELHEALDLLLSGVTE